MPWKNKEDKKAYDKLYRQKHKEEIREKDRQYRLKNKTRLAELHKIWVNNNRQHVRDETRKRMALWRKNNPEKYKAQKRERHIDIRKKIWEYKEQRGCSWCSEKDPRCLDFHHRDPTTKSYNISHGLTNSLSFETLMKEIEKCDLLCRNCHVKTYKRMYIKN